MSNDTLLAYGIIAATVLILVLGFVGQHYERKSRRAGHLNANPKL